MTTILRLGARLRAARKAAGFRTSKEFLQKHSLPASTYSQHESGARSPDEEMLLFYSNTFEVNFDWLKTGKGLPYKKATQNQKEVMTEELTDLKHGHPKSTPINPKLFTKILEELLKLNQTDLSLNKIQSIAKQTIKIYNDINSSNLSEKIQYKLLRNLVKPK